ncbi:MerR-like transcriptional regulator [Bifidobacterium dolichotidis]|uniref:MerR-like transcriptional regulator n=1 Tax=Bifidobacterium dolichotidis TaxID=2306976 RepID=A0A430FSR3_9BIFI|nr:MerR family transcriptional regulator [Bifidobacterium dolichotidis]RSX55890.1 MerR-like transcriptional regulator [Bifidobacterium dolichotidis]
MASIADTPEPQDSAIPTDMAEQTFSTGQIAKHCGVTVRTVQYYDRQGLLEPSGQNQTGRRQYTYDDVRKLEYILLLKQAGLSLAAIRTVMQSPYQTRMLIDLLADAQTTLKQEIQERKHKLTAIRELDNDVQLHGRMTLQSPEDMETTMNNRKAAKRFIIRMVIWSVIADVLWVGTLVWAILTGLWWIFIIGFALAAVIAGVAVKRYYGHVSYWDPASEQEFKPPFWQWFFAMHTPHTRKLRAPGAQEKTWCVEHFHA